MELSQSIKNKIKTWEGCRLTAYRCPAGILTIGYGHTGSDVNPGKRITQAEADALFEADIRKFADSVNTTLKGAKINNNQFDALVSLAYNIGIGAFAKSTLLTKVLADPGNSGIRAEFARWIRGGGKVLPGLVKRRTAEADHYFGLS
nr:MAG TPA: Lysozyme [Caudoviricetes sp.]